MWPYLRHLFIPHHSNNYRAKALQLEALLAYVLIFTVFNIGMRVVHTQFPDVLGYATDIRVDQLLTETNQKRQENGLSTLTLNPTLSQAAAAKAGDMFAKNYWAHVAPDGKTPWDFMNSVGYVYTVAGENLAKNFQDSQAVIDAWMASPSHRENLLKNSYREIGFAVVNGKINGEETTLVVQMFGTRTNSQIAQAPSTPEVAPASVNVPAANPTNGALVKPLVPTPTITPEKKIEIPKEATLAARSEPIEEPSSGLPLGFTAAFKRPVIDMATLTRDITLVFAGILMGVLALDIWYMSRKKIIRVGGHSIGHLLFIGALVIGMSTIIRGSIL